MMDFVVGRPTILNKTLFIKRIEDILDTHEFTNNGKYVCQVEEYISKLYSVKYALCLNNATSGLEACLAYLKTKVSSGQIIVPSFTFVATVAAVVNAGFTPVFADIRNNFCMDPDDVDKKVNAKTVAILPVSLFGNIYNYNDLEQYTNKILIISDSAHAINTGDESTGRCTGSFGDCEVFSNHGTKMAGGFEGGIVTTNNKEIADFIAKYRNFGFSPDTNGQVDIVGLNYKMCEPAAAAILCQLESMEEIATHYYSNYMTYKENLPASVLLCEPNTYFSNFSYVIIRSQRRDELQAYLLIKGIAARTYFQPIHKMEPYRRFLKGKLPMTELISSEILALPTGLCISPQDVIYICQAIEDFSKIDVKKEEMDNNGR
jgi:dTDP-4-amino-4,6-dideoxygalactose transaminase